MVPKPRMSSIEQTQVRNQNRMRDTRAVREKKVWDVATFSTRARMGPTISKCASGLSRWSRFLFLCYVGRSARIIAHPTLAFEDTTISTMTSLPAASARSAPNDPPTAHSHQSPSAEYSGTPASTLIASQLPPSQQQQPYDVSSTWPLSPHYYYNSTVLHTDFSSALSKNPLLNRIGLEPVKRIMLITGSASFWGFMLGGVIGSRQSGMQYLAENAHRLPKNMEGWYFYHKRKNYRMIWGALQKGAMYSAKTGALVGLFEILEASADFYRGGADLLNSMMAGVASGAIFSVASMLLPVFGVAHSRHLCVKKMKGKNG